MVSRNHPNPVAPSDLRETPIEPSNRVVVDDPAFERILAASTEPPRSTSGPETDPAAGAYRYVAPDRDNLRRSPTAPERASSALTADTTPARRLEASASEEPAITKRTGPPPEAASAFEEPATRDEAPHDYGLIPPPPSERPSSDLRITIPVPIDRSEQYARWTLRPAATPNRSRAFTVLIVLAVVLTLALVAAADALLATGADRRLLPHAARAGAPAGLPMDE